MQYNLHQYLPKMKCCSVTKSCPTLCDPTDCSTPSSSVLHCLPEFTQTHVHRVGDAICLILCHTLLLLPLIFSSTGSFPVSWLCTRWLKYWSFSFNNNPSNKYLGLTSFRIDCLDLLAIQVTLKSLFQHNWKASIPHGSAFFMVQLSHLCDYWKDHSFD